MKTLKTIGKALLWTIGLVAIYLLFNLPHFFKTTYEDVKVTDAFVKKGSAFNQSHSKDKYMAFVELKDGSTMELKNVKARLSIDLKWSAATLQSKLSKAKADDIPCTITVYGWRVPFLGMYPNIVKVTIAGDTQRK
jgi:hypothetical protein